MILPVEAGTPCLPYLVCREFELAALVERAPREQAGGAFDVVADGVVPATERAFPLWVVGTEESEAADADMGGEVRQGAIGGDQGFKTGEYGQGSGGGIDQERSGVAGEVGKLLPERAAVRERCDSEWLAGISETFGQVVPAGYGPFVGRSEVGIRQQEKRLCVGGIRPPDGGEEQRVAGVPTQRTGCGEVELDAVVLRFFC